MTLQVEAVSAQQASKQNSKSHPRIIGEGMLVPFILVAMLFPLWALPMT